MDFTVDTDSYISQLGVYVLGDNRYELLPSIVEKSEAIPGRDGEINFGFDFGPRILELKVATDEGLTPIQKFQKLREIAAALNPKSGPHSIVFLDDPTKKYYFVHAGKIDIQPKTSWFDFLLMLKMIDPFIYSTTQKVRTGTSILDNEGSYKSALLIDIPGPATSPHVSVGSNVLTYGGVVGSTETLKIDTGAMTAKIGTTNKLGLLSGTLPIFINTGNTSAIPSISTTTFKWYDRWL
jgi:predicted phage tail component-like protein